jgi:hypothetical protein
MENEIRVCVESNGLIFSINWIKKNRKSLGRVLELDQEIGNLMGIFLYKIYFPGKINVQ